MAHTPMKTLSFQKPAPSVLHRLLAIGRVVRRAFSQLYVSRKREDLALLRAMEEARLEGHSSTTHDEMLAMLNAKIHGFRPA